MSDTIFALATASGRAAIAVVRMSGPASGPVLRALTGSCPAPRRAVLRALRDPASGALLDRGLVLWFPAPGSATGEDMAELHLHGGQAVVAAVLAVLGACPGCRPAEPGAFTRRAYLNGRMDLAEVEGLADLIDAETQAQRRQALRQLDGALGAWVAEQRERLILALAAAEAAIDFSDESDVAANFTAELRGHVTALLDAVRRERHGARRAARVRDGVVVALVGPPNAGKSTLMNALARRDVAIVSPVAGTTRDPIEVRLELDGLLVTLVDTAGLRPTQDPVEREGVMRAHQRARAADLVLWLAEAGATDTPSDPALEGVTLWRVITKIDLARSADLGPTPHRVSALTGEGLPELVEALKSLVEQGSTDNAGLATQERHRQALFEAERHLSTMLEAGEGVGVELAAEQLRAVATTLDSLVGRVAPDDVLGAIFARFCIGK